MKAYGFIHCHSDYSLKDSTNKIEKLCLAAKEMGAKAITLTDHGVCAGHVEFLNACNAIGIKGIPGVEAGDHGCEYMTGGRVVILGRTGRNFAAGMSGGIAYVWNPRGDFDYYCNMEMIELTLLERTADRDELRELISTHVRHTGSALGRQLLESWESSVRQFIKVTPVEYKRYLEQQHRH